MHLTGLMGMPRRVYTYLPDRGWDLPNMISTVGSFMFGLAVVLWMIDMIRNFRPFGPREAGNIHDGPGLEWQGGFLALGIGNGRQAGGGQPLCPDACIDDGLLDVTIIPEGDGMASALGTVLAQGKEGAVEALNPERVLMLPDAVEDHWSQEYQDLISLA